MHLNTCRCAECFLDQKLKGLEVNRRDALRDFSTRVPQSFDTCVETLTAELASWTEDKWDAEMERRL
tara:strand:- start:1054 stop:1254 length:201 start_codon:yes stop_codon:yes gene_type:complete